MTQDQLKEAVARAAIAHVVPDTIVGVGTGSTANFFIDALAEMKSRVPGAVASSEATKKRLEAHGIEVLGITDHHIFDSIYFFDPNGVRLELTAQRADEFQMLQESKTAHARLREWTARKEQWRRDRAEGKADGTLKPQQNDRPEYTAKK